MADRTGTIPLDNHGTSVDCCCPATAAGSFLPFISFTICLKLYCRLIILFSLLKDGIHHRLNQHFQLAGRHTQLQMVNGKHLAGVLSALSTSSFCASNKKKKFRFTMESVVVKQQMVFSQIYNGICSC